jgi:hypothetical protein
MSGREPVSRVCDWLGAAKNPAFARDDKRSISMCDYSLHSVATRPAKLDDKLVITKFHNSITRGFSAVGDPCVAVCLLPGTELAFDRDVECERGLPIFPTKKIGQKVARFRQINMDQPTVHHDALEFANGQIVLLTSLCPGQNATVLQMPVGAHAPTEAGEQSPVTTNETERRNAFID